MPSTGRSFVHIAVGVLQNESGEVLICQRPPHKIYPGEWEFPGGKVEPGEDVQSALRRELREELDIDVRRVQPLISLRHVYPELSVELDTWLVTDWEGEPRSNEHPAEAWVAPDALPRWALLAADRPIVNALRLPNQIVFTPPRAGADELVAQLEHLPERALLRLRLPAATDADYAVRVAALAAGTRLVVDRCPERIPEWRAAGFHATAARLRAFRHRPVAEGLWFGASCHDAGELAVARAVRADYAVLGPVKPTATHEGARALGWAGFARLARNAGLPVYAIGGLGPQDVEDARRHGAQGVAGISAYWRGGS